MKIRFIPNSLHVKAGLSRGTSYHFSKVLLKSLVKENFTTGGCGSLPTGRPPLLFLVTIPVSYCCCNILLINLVLRAAQIYCLSVLQVRSLKWVSLNNIKVRQGCVLSWRLRGNLFSCLFWLLLPVFLAPWTFIPSSKHSSFQFSPSLSSPSSPSPRGLSYKRPSCLLWANLIIQAAFATKGNNIFMILG